MKMQELLFQAEQTLGDTITMLKGIDQKKYTSKLDIFEDRTIGEHTRHIIELFQQLDHSYENGRLNYDERERNTKIQENIFFAIDCLKNLISSLKTSDKKLKLKGVLLGENQEIETSYYRELAFNIDHCVHHHAIIKIGLKSLGSSVGRDFGYAASTKAYEKQCAQ